MVAGAQNLTADMSKYDQQPCRAAVATTLTITRVISRVMTLNVYVMHDVVLSTGGQ